MTRTDAGCQSMTQLKRAAPNPEWVLKYLRGIPTPKIAVGARVAETTVRYHLAIAARQDPALRAEHQAALPPAPPQLTAAGQRNLEDILALYGTESRSCSCLAEPVSFDDVNDLPGHVVSGGRRLFARKSNNFPGFFFAPKSPRPCPGRR